jgi:hypothetical protein
MTNQFKAMLFLENSFDLIYDLFWIVLIFYMITPRSKPYCSWETSNGFFVSIQKKVLFFLKYKLSASKLNLSLELRPIDDPQNFNTSSFEESKSLRGRTNGSWIDELLVISVAKTVVALRKSVNMQHRKSNVSKVSPLGLVQSDYFPNLGMNSRKACLPKRTLFTNLSTVLGVQDIHQETQCLCHVFPNCTGQCRSNSNMIPRKNTEWNSSRRNNISFDSEFYF